MISITDGQVLRREFLISTLDSVPSFSLGCRVLTVEDLVSVFLLLIPKDYEADFYVGSGHCEPRLPSSSCSLFRCSFGEISVSDLLSWPFLHLPPDSETMRRLNLFLLMADYV